MPCSPGGTMPCALLPRAVAAVATPLVPRSSPYAHRHRVDAGVMRERPRFEIEAHCYRHGVPRSPRARRRCLASSRTTADGGIGARCWWNHHHTTRPTGHEYAEHDQNDSASHATSRRAGGVIGGYRLARPRCEHPRARWIRLDAAQSRRAGVRAPRRSPPYGGLRVGPGGNGGN